MFDNFSYNNVDMVELVVCVNLKIVKIAQIKLINCLLVFPNILLMSGNAILFDLIGKDAMIYKELMKAS